MTAEEAATLLKDADEEDGEVPNGAANPYVDKDGKFIAGWKEALVPTDLRDRKVYETVVDLKGALKQLGHQDRLVGLPKIPIPNDKSPPEEWDAYYKAGGRPDSPDDYKLDVPEDLKDYYDADLVKEARSIFHSFGMSQKQADALWAFEKSRLERGLKQVAQAEAEDHDAAEKALRDRWGAAYDERLAVANRMIEQNCPDAEAKAHIVERYGNDPILADFLASIGGRFLEHKVGADAAMSDTVVDEIERLQKTPGYVDGSLKRTDPKQHDRITGRLRELYAKKYVRLAESA